MFKTPEDRLSEIQLYDLVAEELQNGEQVRGLWFKAIADADGDEEKAKPLYLKYRVQMIRDEIVIAAKEAKEKESPRSWWRGGSSLIWQTCAMCGEEKNRADFSAPHLQTCRKCEDLGRWHPIDEKRKR
jgi:hypothetical protein